jgi:hypothetical protein
MYIFGGKAVDQVSPRHYLFRAIKAVAETFRLSSIAYTSNQEFSKSFDAQELGAVSTGVSTTLWRVWVAGRC